MIGIAAAMEWIVGFVAKINWTWIARPAVDSLIDCCLICFHSAIELNWLMPINQINEISEIKQTNNQ